MGRAPVGICLGFEYLRENTVGRCCELGRFCSAASSTFFPVVSYSIPVNRPPGLANTAHILYHLLHTLRVAVSSQPERPAVILCECSGGMSWEPPWDSLGLLGCTTIPPLYPTAVSRCISWNSPLDAERGLTGWVPPPSYHLPPRGMLPYSIPQDVRESLNDKSRGTPWYSSSNRSSLGVQRHLSVSLDKKLAIIYTMCNLNNHIFPLNPFKICPLSKRGLASPRFVPRENHKIVWMPAGSHAGERSSACRSLGRGGLSCAFPRASVGGRLMACGLLRSSTSCRYCSLEFP